MNPSDIVFFLISPEMRDLFEGTRGNKVLMSVLFHSLLRVGSEALEEKCFFLLRDC